MYLKIMKKILLYFSILFFFSSCRKDGPLYDGTCSGDCITVTGKLTVQQTGIGLEGADLKFYFERNSSGLGGNPKTDFLGVIKTELDGFYLFKISRKDFISQNGRLIIKTDLPNYVNRKINSDDEIERINLFPSTDTTVTLNLSLWNASPLRIRVRTGNSTSFDQFYFTQIFGSAISYNNSVRGRRNFDTTFFKLTASDVRTFINWKTGSLGLNSGSTILSGSDSIILVSGSSGDIFIQLP